MQKKQSRYVILTLSDQWDQNSGYPVSSIAGVCDLHDPAISFAPWTSPGPLPFLDDLQLVAINVIIYVIVPKHFRQVYRIFLLDVLSGRVNYLRHLQIRFGCSETPAVESQQLSHLNRDFEAEKPRLSQLYICMNKE